MSTSAPIKKEYDIPIIRRNPVEHPLRLPEVFPERIVTIPFVSPVRVPERVEVRR